MINVLQSMLDRRRVVKGGVAAGAALALNHLWTPSGVYAQDEPDLPSDASDMDVT